MTTAEEPVPSYTAEVVTPEAMYGDYHSFPNKDIQPWAIKQGHTGGGASNPQFLTTYQLDTDCKVRCVFCDVAYSARSDNFHTHRKGAGRTPCPGLKKFGGGWDFDLVRNGRPGCYVGVEEVAYNLLWKFPELAQTGFAHPQITGILRSQLEQWWVGQTALQSKFRDGTMMSAVKSWLGA